MLDQFILIQLVNKRVIKVFFYVKQHLNILLMLKKNLCVKLIPIILEFYFSIFYNQNKISKLISF